MKKLLTAILLICGFIGKAQYNPSIHFPVVSDAIGISQATPTDARSMYFITSTFTYRNYATRAEANTYLNLAKYRTGRFSIYIDSAGHTYEYYYRDCLSDTCLVLKSTSVVNMDSVLFATNYRVDTAKVNLRTAIAGKISTVLPAGQIIVGSFTNVATPVTPTNDISITTGGSVTVNNQWKLIGNSGTADLSNFIGTTDNVPLTLKVNNQPSARITSSGNQTYFGYQSGNGANSLFTTAIGFQALQNNIGNYNTATGYLSLNANTSGSGNEAYGFRALLSNTTGINNIAFGHDALGTNTTGQHNAAVGYDALFNNVTGSFNTAFGYSAGNNILGDSNLLIGHEAGSTITTGKNNVVLGSFPGPGITTGNYNVIIGNNVTGLATGLNNNIIIADGQGRQKIKVDSFGTTIINSTTALGLPTGTTAQRPSSPAIGYIRYNTDSVATETWNGSVWVKAGTGGGGGGGSVTSVGSGFGLSGGPITGTGSLLLDTTLGGTLNGIHSRNYNDVRYQPTGNYITALTGDVVATGPGSVAATIQANAVTTTKINNNAVTLTKQATNTVNTLQGFDGSGNASDITLTTTGSSGAATISAGVLNIPQYSGGGSVTVRDSLSYINVSKFGVVADGSTDNTAKFQSLINLGYKSFYFPGAPLSYNFGSTIRFSDSMFVFGDGHYSRLKITANDTLFSITKTLGGKNSTIKDITIVGTNGAGGNTNQMGIVVDSVSGCLFFHIGFYFMAGSGGKQTNNGYLPFNSFTYGNKWIGCYGETNATEGIWLGERAEYTTVSDCNFGDGGIGFRNAGGNNIFSNINGSTCAIGLYLEGGSNNTHGEVSNGTFNHCSKGLYSNGVTLGMDLINCHFYADSIVIDNCADIVVMGGTIEATGVRITNSTNILFKQPRINSPTTNMWVVTSSTGSIDETVNGGSRLTNLAYPSKVSNLSTQDNIRYYGATSAGSADLTDSHQFFQPIIGVGGSSDGSGRSFYGISSRINVLSGNTISDPVEIYSVNSIGSSFAIFNNSKYIMRQMPSGNTGFGTAFSNTPDASALVDMTSTNQGLLIPRMTTTQMNAISSPATSLLIFNTTTGTYKFYTGSVWQDLGGGSSTPDTLHVAKKGSGLQIGYTNGADTLFLKSIAGLKSISITTGSDSTNNVQLVNDTTGSIPSYYYGTNAASRLGFYPITSGISTMGSFGSTPNSNGASISGSTLTLQPANGSNPGGISTTTQTLAGLKTFSSDISIPHLIGTTATPSISAGSGAGTSPTISIVGNDMAGEITVTAGTAPTNGQIIATITFGSTLSSAARVFLQPSDAALGSGIVFPTVITAGTTTAFSFYTNTITGLTGGLQYKWAYFTVQ